MALADEILKDKRVVCITFAYLDNMHCICVEMKNGEKPWLFRDNNFGGAICLAYMRLHGLE
jgi:hypothetical protein